MLLLLLLCIMAVATKVPGSGYRGGAYLIVSCVALMTAGWVEFILSTVNSLSYTRYERHIYIQ